MEITSVHNPRVKQWAQLLDRKGRMAQGKFLIEGTHLVLEALKSQEELECVVFSLDKGIPGELTEYAGQRTEWLGASDAVIAKCTDAKTPQPVFAVVRKPAADDAAWLQDPQALVVVVDGVQDPGNLGTIIRSADAVGASGVVLGKGTVDLFNPKTVRSTMGSLFHLPIVEADLTELLPKAEDAGAKVIGTSLQADKNCYEHNFTTASWIVLGNESAGVSPETEAFVTDRLIIPMRGQSESLNVAMAATVLLYEALRQREYYQR
ncbi:TrmH family RNA methyltransferase [Paenibacillus gansuensis]|uniref:TrmH family RNA methyltransferase n=1 Tax=Paenibacillus gansuensis TaxID=306542 RepID=A0ABW5PJX7_9BACL